MELKNESPTSIYTSKTAWDGLKIKGVKVNQAAPVQFFQLWQSYASPLKIKEMKRCKDR